jgi:hypothetical protein
MGEFLLGHFPIYQTVRETLLITFFPERFHFFAV